MAFAANIEICMNVSHDKGVINQVNPHYSCKNGVNCMNAQWVVGCNVGNPDLVELSFEPIKNGLKPSDT